MRYVSVTYPYSPDVDSPEGWFKRTKIYAGIFERIATDNEVINVKQINYEGTVVHNGVEYRFVNLNRPKTHFPFRLNRFVKKLKPDVVVIQGLHNPIQATLLHLILPKKTKFIAHNHAEKPIAGYKVLAQKIADRFMDAYLFASRDMGLEWVEQGIISSPAKVHEVMEVSSNFYPLDKVIARQKTGVSGGPVFLWVGRLNDNKDPLNVIGAFLKYTEVNPEARLYMLYHTEELLPEIKKLLEGHPGGQAIVLVGQQPHDDLLYWFNSADFFLSGSHYEGSGTALCEAISCGCIPVVTDILSFRMITNEGKCGLLYPPGDEEALLSALIETGKMNMSEKRDLCLEDFKQKLSFDVIAAIIQEIAKNL